jgi:hypothetical protein
LYHNGGLNFCLPHNNLYSLLRRCHVLFSDCNVAQQTAATSKSHSEILLVSLLGMT